MDFTTFLKYHFSWKLSLFALLLSVLMLTAASWQWRRYHEKKILEQSLAENFESDSVDILDLDTEGRQVSPFTKVFLTGSFDHDNQQLIMNRRHKYGSGSWLFTPFTLSGSDTTYMVSRGFIPYEDKDPESLSKYRTEGIETIYGLTQNSVGKRTALSPSAESAVGKSNWWLYPDLPLIQKVIPHRIQTDFYIQQFSRPVHNQFPAEDIKIDVPSSTHFWYTFEWIFLALFTLFISFIIQLFRPRIPPHLPGALVAVCVLFTTVILNENYAYCIQDPSDIAQRAGIIERLGNHVSLDIELTDESGERRTLKEFIDGDMPVVIAPVYFECPRLCTLTQEGLLKAVLGSDLKLGNDYQIFSVSFNHLENSGQAKERSRAYHKSLVDKDGITPESWKFMVGSEEHVGKLMREIGFNYEYDEGEYMHAAGLILINPDGLITRYLYGIEFRPRDFKLGILETSEGKIGSFMSQALMFCFRYDHIKGQYTLAIWNIIRFFCVLFVVILIGFLVKLRVKEFPKNDLAKSEKDL
jgi:protein SCO1